MEPTEPQTLKEMLDAIGKGGMEIVNIILLCRQIAALLALIIPGYVPPDFDNMTEAELLAWAAGVQEWSEEIDAPETP